MRKFIIVALALILVAPAMARVRDLFVGAGTETPATPQGVGTGYFAASVETDGPLVLDVPNVIPVDDTSPDVIGGNTFRTSANTIATDILVLDNEYPGAEYTIYCGSIAGGFQSTITDGGNFTLEDDWVPVAVGDSIRLLCTAANTYIELERKFVGADGGPVIGDPFLAGADAIGAPGHSWQGDPNTGLQNSGPNVIAFVTNGAIRGDVDDLGAEFVALDNTPIGAVAPAAVTGTNGNFTGNFGFGQDFGELHAGYKDRSNYITFSDTFDVGSNADLAVRWTLAVVGGGSTVNEATVPGWCQLDTGGAGGPDSAILRSNVINHYRAYLPRFETVVDLGAVAAGQTFSCGFYAGAAEYALIFHEPATSPNWLLRVDDGGGGETINSGIAATLNPTKLEIRVATNGAVTWAIDDVAMTVVGLTNLMTANGHYARWSLLDVAAAAHIVNIDYYLSEQLKQQ
jgi:hypothetical protein